MDRERKRETERKREKRRERESENRIEEGNLHSTDGDVWESFPKVPHRRASQLKEINEGKKKRKKEGERAVVDVYNDAPSPPVGGKERLKLLYKER